MIYHYQHLTADTRALQSSQLGSVIRAGTPRLLLLSSLILLRTVHCIRPARISTQNHVYSHHYMPSPASNG